MTAKPQFKIKLQIHCGDEIAMGPGKADLLEAIRDQGSISAAARAMDMSYRRAWLLVDTMNRCWDAPLVHAVPGRAQGSGARLTETGETVLARFRALQHSLNDAGAVDRAGLAGLLLPQPRDSQKV